MTCEGKRAVLSYREKTGAETARSITQALEQAGAEIVLDTDAIRPGQDWQDRIREEIESCDVLVVIVDADWNPRQGLLGRRLNDRLDPVRFELEAASRAARPILPVLVSGAHMPPVRTLPESIRGFARLNALKWDPGTGFKEARDQLVQRVGSPLPGKSLDLIPSEDPGAPRGSAARPWLLLMAGCGLIVSVALMSRTVAWTLECYRPVIGLDGPGGTSPAYACRGLENWPAGVVVWSASLAAMLAALLGLSRLRAPRTWCRVGMGCHAAVAIVSSIAWLTMGERVNPYDTEYILGETAGPGVPLAIALGCCGLAAGLLALHSRTTPARL